MATADLNHVLARARRLAAGSAAPPDAALLARFVGQRDEAAFTALVARHGAMGEGEAYEYVKRMLADKRYVRDVY